MRSQPSHPIEVFISYAHKDERLRKQLSKHLTGLKREGLISEWYDREIDAGEEWHQEIVARLRRAAIILLLVSPDFMDSDYVNDVEIREAMRRHEEGLAHVIPVILRPADWKNSPLGKLQALPTDGRPVTLWRPRDKALLNIAEGIRGAVRDPPPVCKGVPVIPREPSFGFVPRRDRNDQDWVKCLQEALSPGMPRFVMLSGLEGMGKTTLAAEATRRLEVGYNKCVVWSDPGGRVDYTLQSLLDDIATQLGHGHLRALAPDVKDERLLALLTLQPTLVVLDNYDTVAVKELAQIDEFLGRGHCSVLYISLRRGRKDQKRRTTAFTLQPMSPDESEQLVRSLAGAEQDSEVLAAGVPQRIHNAAEGRPTLIEWIVSQIDAGAEEPDEVFENVARGEGDVLQRVFAPSFKLLRRDGRASLLALSLFPASATRKSLGSVLGFRGERLTNAIWDLRSLMLLEVDNEYKPSRLEIKGVTRRLAGKLLSKDKNATADYWRRNFVEHYKAQVDDDEWVKGLQLRAAPVAERSNVLRAMQFASHIGDWDTVMDLYCKTKRHVHGFNVWRRAIDFAEREAEEELGDVDNPSSPIIIQIKHRDINKVRNCYKRLKREGGRVGDKILKKLEGGSSKRQGAKATSKLSRKSGKKPPVLTTSELETLVELSVVEFELGVFAYSDGEYLAALKHYEKAKRYKEAAKDRRGFATVCNNLGAALAKAGHQTWLEDAKAEFNRASRIYKEKESNFTKVVDKNMKWLKREARRHASLKNRKGSRK